MTNLSFMKIQNYSLPDVNGTKNFSFNNSIMTSLNVLTVDILYGNYIKIIYNNSVKVWLKMKELINMFIVI